MSASTPRQPKAPRTPKAPREPKSPRTPKARRPMPLGVRIIGGTILAAGVATVVVAGTLAPWPSIPHTPVSILPEPAAAAASATCTGPLLAAGRNALDAAEISVAADATAVGEGEQTLIPGITGGEFAVFTGPAGGGAAGAQTSSIVSADLTGFAASICPVPSFQSWLAVGSTTTGAADLIVLTNPGDVAATVDLTVFGSADPVLTPGGTGIILAPRSQQVVPLAGLVIGERDPMVRVSATGAPIVAAMQTAFTQTLEPVGIDVVAGAASASPVQIIPAVVVPEASATGAAPIEVRVLAPDANAIATITATRVGSGTPSATSTLTLVAGTTIKASLTDLSPGTYVVRVSSAPAPVTAPSDAAADATPPAPTATPSSAASTVPIDPTAPVQIVASAMTATAAPRDIGWFVAAPAVASETPVVTGPGATTTLVVAAGDEDATIVITEEGGGAPSERRVPAGGSVDIDVPAGTVWRLASDVPVHASVAYSGPGILAATPVQASADQAPALRIFP